MSSEARSGLAPLTNTTTRAAIAAAVLTTAVLAARLAAAAAGYSASLTPVKGSTK